MTNMGLVVIRKAQVDDEQAVMKIHQAAVEASCKEYYRPEQIQAWAVPRGLPPFAQILKKTIFLLAEYDGEVVGFSHMDPKKGGCPSICVNGLPLIGPASGPRRES
jgi:hypothetical protein